jgi:hypothetical protein
MNTISQNIMRLSEGERGRVFKLLSTNADVINKIIPGMPLIEYILTGVDITANDSEVVQAYSAWKTKN